DLAKDAVRAGQVGKNVDSAARTFLTEGGYGQEFSHSLGHGLGIDVHEQPRLSRDSDDELESGMVVTIEPGIYIGGWGGIRIEDSVIVRDGSYEVLNHAPKTPVI
ncbi:MAG: M24 family metallopeptidase, partial [Chloroflexota bacterium]|nr:M24 family metallopeptidase [Chloroflexota bacterium]